MAPITIVNIPPPTTSFLATLAAGAYAYYCWEAPVATGFNVAVMPTNDSDPDIRLAVVRPLSTSTFDAVAASSREGADTVTVAGTEPWFGSGIGVAYYLQVYGYTATAFYVQLTYGGASPTPTPTASARSSVSLAPTPFVVATLTPDRPVVGSIDAGKRHYYGMTNLYGRTPITITLTAVTGDPDLYVSLYWPDGAAFYGAASSTRSGSDELIVSPSDWYYPSQGGNMYIAVYGSTSASYRLAVSVVVPVVVPSLSPGFFVLMHSWGKPSTHHLSNTDLFWTLDTSARGQYNVSVTTSCAFVSAATGVTLFAGNGGLPACTSCAMQHTYEAGTTCSGAAAGAAGGPTTRTIYVLITSPPPAGGGGTMWYLRLHRMPSADAPTPMIVSAQFTAGTGFAAPLVTPSRTPAPYLFAPIPVSELATATLGGFPAGYSDRSRYYSWRPADTPYDALLNTAAGSTATAYGTYRIRVSALGGNVHVKVSSTPPACSSNSWWSCSMDGTTAYTTAATDAYLLVPVDSTTAPLKWYIEVATSFSGGATFSLTMTKVSNSDGAPLPSPSPRWRMWRPSPSSQPPVWRSTPAISGYAFGGAALLAIFAVSVAFVTRPYRLRGRRAPLSRSVVGANSGELARVGGGSSDAPGTATAPLAPGAAFVNPVYGHKAGAAGAAGGGTTLPLLAVSTAAPAPVPAVPGGTINRACPSCGHPLAIAITVTSASDGHGHGHGHPSAASGPRARLAAFARGFQGSPPTPVESRSGYGVPGAAMAARRALGPVLAPTALPGAAADYHAATVTVTLMHVPVPVAGS